MLIRNDTTEEMIEWLQQKGVHYQNTFFDVVAQRLAELEKLRKVNDT
jgi:hypothetical protein